MTAAPQVVDPQLLDSVYATAYGEQSWQTTLNKVADAFDVRGATLELHHRTQGPLQVITSQGLEEKRQEFSEEFALSARLLATREQAVGAVTYDYLFFDEAQMSRDAMYEDFLRPNGVRYYAGCNVVKTPHLHGIFTLQRQTGLGHFQSADLQRFKSLSSHVVRAHDMERRLGQGKVALESLGALLMRYSSAALVVDANADILLHNDVASGLFDGATLSSNKRRLQFTNRRAHKRFTRALADEFYRGADFHIPRPGATPLRIKLLPLAIPSLQLSLEDRLYALVIDDPDRPTPLDEVALQQAFGLTQEQAQVLTLLHAGHNPRQISQQLQATYNTVGRCLTVLRQKLAAGSQAELVAIASRYASRNR